MWIPLLSPGAHLFSLQSPLPRLGLAVSHSDRAAAGPHGKGALGCVDGEESLTPGGLGSRIFKSLPRRVVCPGPASGMRQALLLRARSSSRHNLPDASWAERPGKGPTGRGQLGRLSSGSSPVFTDSDRQASAAAPEPRAGPGLSPASRPRRGPASGGLLRWSCPLPAPSQPLHVVVVRFQLHLFNPPSWKKLPTRLPPALVRHPILHSSQSDAYANMNWTAAPLPLPAVLGVSSKSPPWLPAPSPPQHTRNSNQKPPFLKLVPRAATSHTAAI